MVAGVDDHRVSAEVCAMGMCSRDGREQPMNFPAVFIISAFLSDAGGIPDSYAIHQDTFDEGTVKDHQYLFIRSYF